MGIGGNAGLGWVWVKAQTGKSANRKTSAGILEGMFFLWNAGVSVLFRAGMSITCSVQLQRARLSSKGGHEPRSRAQRLQSVRSAINDQELSPTRRSK